MCWGYKSSVTTFAAGACMEGDAFSIERVTRIGKYLFRQG